MPANPDPDKNKTIIDGNAKPLLPAGPQFFGRYKIQKELARGGMGIVYLAESMDLNVKVALKILRHGHTDSAQYQSRFLQEARLASKLNHTNIVRVLDFGSEKDLDYMVMEFIEGEDLKNKIWRDGPLPWKEAIQLMLPVCEAMEYAHSHHIIHRDLKTANILLTASGKPMVTDFGLAKDLSEDSSLTQSGVAMGSPGYMSPEQIQGKKTDFRTDIYALGVILFHLFTGKMPFEGETAGVIYGNTLHKPVPSLRQYSPDLPAGLDKICQKAMAKIPEKRYGKAEDLKSDLEKILQKVSLKKTPPSHPENPKSKKKIFTISLLFLGGLFFLFFSLTALQKKTKNKIKSPSKSTASKTLRDPAGASKTESPKEEEPLPSSISQALEEGDYYTAWKESKIFLKDHPGHSLALMACLRSLFSLEERKEFKELWKKSSSLLPRDENFSFLQGLVYLDENPSALATYLKEEKKFFPEDYEFLKGSLLYSQSREEEAFISMDIAVQKKPKRMDLASWKSCSKHYYYLNKKSPRLWEFVQECEEVSQRFPKEMGLSALLGYFYMQRNPEKAQMILIQSWNHWKEIFKLPRTELPASMNRNFPWFLCLLGRSYLYTRNPSEALRWLYIGLRKYPEDGTLCFWIISTYRTQQRISEAIQFYEKCLLQPETVISATVGICYLYLEQKDFFKIIEVASQVIGKTPHRDLYSCRAMAYQNLKNWGNMAEDLEKAFLLGAPEEKAIQAVEIYFQLKKHTRALDLSNKILQKSENFLAYLFRAKIQIERRNADSARKDLQKIIDRCRDEPVLQEARNLLARLPPS